jgi:hypothetical protein
VTAAGDGTLAYSWFKDGVVMPGFVQPTLQIPIVEADDAGDYHVRISSEFGTVNSEAASLTVIVAPEITDHPQSLAITAGEAAVFSVTATGTEPLSYQWLRNSEPIPGAQASVLNLESATFENAGSYQVRVSNPAGQVLSDGAVLTVNLPPAITEQPEADSYLVAGETVALAAEVSGTAPLSYQWYQGLSGDTSLPVAGATALEFESPPVVANTGFWLQATNPYGTADSITAFVTVGIPPSITTPLVSQTVEKGGAFTLSVSVAGDGPFTYAWYKNFTLIENQTGPELTFSNVHENDAGSYQVAVSNLFGNISSNATITVVDPSPPQIVNSLASRVAAEGANTTFTVIATGSVPLAYQWFKGEAPLAGATAASLTLGPLFLSDSGEYWCRASNVAGSDDSNRAVLEVLQVPVILRQPPSSVIATGSTAELDVLVSGSGPFDYQWFDGLPGDVTNPVGMSSAEFTTPELLENRSYWVRVSNAAGSADSNAASVTVMEPVAITTSPANQTVDAGDFVEFSVAATGGGELSYQWRFNGADLPDETNATLSLIAGFFGTGNYTVVVTNPVSRVESPVAALTVLSPPVIAAFTGGSFSQGDQMVLSPSVTGSPVLSYRWQLNGEDLVGETSPVLTRNPVSVTDGGIYTVIVTNPYGTASAQASVVVEGPPVVLGISASGGGGYGTSSTLQVETAGPGPIHYSWHLGFPGDTSQPVGQDSPSFITPALTATTRYWVRVTNPFGSVDSLSVELVVVPPLPVISSPTVATATAGSVFSYRIQASYGPTSFSAAPLPAGLSLNPATGLISGVPVASGDYLIDLAASNAVLTGNATLSLVVNPPKPVLTGIDALDGRIGEAMHLNLAITNGTSSIQFVNLPAWLVFDSVAGTLSGTPDAAGVFTFQALLENEGGITVHPFTFTVATDANAPTITSPPFAAGTVDTALLHEFTALPPATQFVLTGTLPDGVVWNAFTGRLSGVPQESGEFEFSVVPQNAAGSGAAQTFTLRVEAGSGRPRITHLTEFRAYADEVFSLLLEATNNPTSFEVQGLPPGLGLVEDGGDYSISGQPLFTGSTPFQVRAVNSNGPGAWTDHLIDVQAGRFSPVLTSGPAAAGRLTLPFVFQLTATENPTVFAATGLPPGLALNEATGLINGVPLTAGEFIVSVTASNLDGPGPALNMVFDIGAEPGAPVIATQPEFYGRVGQPFSAFIESTEDPLLFTALGVLPPGIGLIGETGELAGTPTLAGRFEIMVTAESAFGFVSEPTTLVMQIQPPPGAPNVTNALAISGSLGSPLNFSITGDEIITQAHLGPLPPGLTRLPGTYLISGTPTLAGTFTVSLRLSNDAGAGLPVDLVFSILPGSATPRISSETAFQIDYAAEFQHQVTAINGPITAWRFENLPPGLTYDALTGEIQGRAARVGTWDARISASNGNGFGVAQTVRFTVKAGPATPVVYSATYVLGWQSQELAYRIQATNLPEDRPLPASSRFFASNLPQGFTLEPETGVIRGIPNKGATFSTEVWAKNSDGEGNRTTVTFDLKAYNPSFKLSAPGFASGLVGTPLPITLVANQTISRSFLDSGEYTKDLLGSSYPGNLLHYFETIPAARSGPVITLAPKRAGQVYVGLSAEAGSYGDFIKSLVHILPGPNNATITSPGEFYFVAGQPMPDYPLSATAPVGSGDTTIGAQGPLPAGVYFDSGFIRGQIDIPGTYTFRLAAYNDFGPGIAKDIRFYVAPSEAAPVITAVNPNGFALRRSLRNPGTPVIEGEVGSLLSASINAGDEIDEFRVDVLPDGLILNAATGQILGIPEQPGDSLARFSVRRGTAWSAPFTVNFRIAAAAGAPEITSVDTLSAQVGVPFSHQLEANPAALSYNIIGAPAGFVIDTETGAISGTFDTPGGQVWQVSGNNIAGQGETQLLRIQVAAPAGTPAINDPGTIAGVVGVPLSLQLVASGSPDEWDVDGLPLGLDFDRETGEISGAPLVAGQFTFIARASNAVGFGNGQTLAFEITPPPAPAISVFDAMEPSGVPLSNNQTSPVDFGDHPLPLSTGGVTRLFRVKNTGTAPLNISSVTGPLGNFEITSPTTPLEIEPDAFFDFSVRFSTNIPGTFTGSISIYSNSPDHPSFTFPIAATGLDVTPPVVQVSMFGGTMPPGSPFGPNYAKAGSDIFLYITSSEPILEPVVTICGKSVTAYVSGNSWGTSTTVDETFPQGYAAISVTATDLAGNTANPVTSHSSGNAIIVDTIAPTMLSSWMSSDNPTPGWAKTGNTIYIGFTMSEQISNSVSLLVFGSPWMGTVMNNFGSFQVISNPISMEPEGPVVVTFECQDLAGNGATFSPVAFDAPVVVDRTPPQITQSSLTAELIAPGGSPVSFVPTVTDALGAIASVSSNPPSGSVFAPGSTSVSVNATDSAGNTGSGAFQVTMLEPGDYWRDTYFDQIANSGDAADGADPDKDGLLNLIERAFNLHPLQASTTILTTGTGTSGLPLVTAQGEPGNLRLRMEYIRRKSNTNPGLSYLPQFSGSLRDDAPEGWQPVAGETVSSVDDRWERVVVEGAPDPVRRFGRVKVTSP